jgi:hypothetical protein
MLSRAVNVAGIAGTGKHFHTTETTAYRRIK